MSLRVFQVGNIYEAHLNQLRARLDALSHFAETQALILSDVAHAQLLAPCIEGTAEGALCFPQYGRGLRLWAEARGMPSSVTEDDILLSMIEDHRAEVFYSVNATRHSKAFMSRMPGCVRLKLAWLGSNPAGDGLSLFDGIVSNFPTLNARHRAMGFKTYYHAPSYETQTDAVYDPALERSVDIFFAGTFSRHHVQRAKLITSLAELVQAKGWEGRFHLLNSRYTTLAERTPLGWVEPFRSVRRPRSLRRLARPASLGAEMFASLARTKLVINMAIDIAGTDRGNMRCFEALSAGAVMLSDNGVYPEGFVAGETHLTYDGLEDALRLTEVCLTRPKEYLSIGVKGAQMIRSRYSKAAQWAAFEELCDRLSPQARSK